MADIMKLPEMKWPKPRQLMFHSRRAEFEHRKSQLASERNEYIEEMRDISDHMQVRRGRFLMTPTRKKRRNSTIYNEKGIFASRICGAGMLAGVSSPSMPWLKLGTPDKSLNEEASVKAWIDECELWLYQVFAGSNYYHVKHQGYRDMADFGQGPVLLDEDYENAINCYCSPPGEYYLAVDRTGVVDTMYRDMTRTTLNLIQEFGDRGNIPREVREAYDKGNYDHLWNVVAVIQPNLHQVEGEPGVMGRPFVSIYYCLDCSDQERGNAILAVNGVHENPISAPRWDLQPGDVYGDGPGSLALGAVKSLQVLERRKGQMVDKMASPAMQGPETMKDKRSAVNHMPGALSYYPSTAVAGAAGKPISPLYEIAGPQLQAVLMEANLLEQRIDTAYFVDLFLATINSDRRQVTATEIAERHEEKLIALGPVLQRVHFEGLNHDIRRAFGVLARNKVLPPPPPAADGQTLQVEYISLLASAQRAIGAGPIERFAGFIGNLAAGKPDILDKWDMEATVDEYAEVVGVPGRIVRTTRQVNEIRKKNMQQQQGAQAMEVAKGAADTAKVLSEADTGRDSNLLAEILGSGAGAGGLV